MVKSETPVIDIRSVDDPFSDTARLQLESVLPDFLIRRRWFRSKARTIQKAAIEDVLPAHDARSYFLVIRLEYTNGSSDEYLLALMFGDGTAAERPPDGSDVVAAYRTADGSEGNVYDALAEPSFRSLLLEAIASKRSFPGRRGDLVASSTKAFTHKGDVVEPKLDSFVSRAEQSNTSIVYGDRYILKLFRKIEPGINPDIEVGAFLTERGFRHTPAVLGAIEYTRKGDAKIYAAGLLQQFVRNRGDAWKYTLESLSNFFERVLAKGARAPALPSYHPLELASEPLPSQTCELLGAYVDSARLLGRRTAEMHAALADPHGGPDFAPQPFTSQDGRKLYEEMLAQADIAFELLRRKEAMLTDGAAQDARMLLRAEHRVTERFLPLRDQPVTAARVRLHGDYHLGQVLYTGTDFMIIDFEGEPARPLAERRNKTLGMRDVAGMVRSFQYAAYTAVSGRISELAADSKMIGAIESWAAFWAASISATYLNGYFSAAEGLAFISANPDERRIIFDSFLLQKALYELAYELNNRPDWVRIPLRGIAALINE